MNKWDEYDTKEVGINSWTDFGLLQSYAKGIILDVGCGRGKMINSLKADRKCGIDPSLQALKKAMENCPNCLLRRAIATQTGFMNEAFDLVYSLEVIEHVKDYRNMLQEAYRILKPGGYIYTQTPNYPIKHLYDFLYWLKGNRYSWKDDYTHVSRFSARRLKQELSTLFEIKVVETRNILWENKISILKNLRLKRHPLSLLLGQKTIIVGQKL